MIHEFADLQLDSGRRQLRRLGKPVKLTKLSFDVLVALVEAAPNLLTQNELIDKVWGSKRVISPENLSQRVTILRQSLGEDSNNPVYIEAVYGQGFRLIPDVTVVAPHPPHPVRNSSGHATKAIAALLVVGLLGWAAYTFELPFGRSAPASGEEKNAAPISIAVLPFLNLSNDARQENFVDGLTEEILNSLVKIDGLLVAGRTSSFVYKNKSADLRIIANELDVEYLLEGSVRKDGDQIRVTSQLIDAVTGSHVFSSAYDRKLVDVFAVQNEISHQVAAELKISLIYKDDQYNTALARLDSIAIEQLLSARAKIAEYSGTPVREAIYELNELNTKYPNTPEIMGLTARGHMIYGSTGSLTKNEVPIDYVQLSHAALELDPTNLDALLTLAVTYDDDPQFRIDAIQYYQKIIRFHPGNKEGYTHLLGYLPMVSTACETIKALVDSVPAGRIAGVTRAEYDQQYETCMSTPWQSMWTDKEYDWSVARVEENPNQRFLTTLFLLQLQVGAFEAARKTELHIDYVAGGWWVGRAALFKYLYNRPSEVSLKEHIRLFVGANYGAYFQPALILTHHGLLTGDFAYANQYLDMLLVFPVEIGNEDSAIGLMMLQHHSGQAAASALTASELLRAMNQYLLDHPGSYRYYNLAKDHLIAAFYAGDFDEAQRVLDTGFATNHPYWLDGHAEVRTALAPWIEHPVAVKYLNRIELDRQRARSKLGVE